MFSQIKMLITLVMVIGLAGGAAYIYKLKGDNATLKANQIEL